MCNRPVSYQAISVAETVKYVGSQVKPATHYSKDNNHPFTLSSTFLEYHLTKLQLLIHCSSITRPPKMEHLCVCLEMMSKHYRNYKHIKCNIQVRGFLVAPSLSTVTQRNTRGHIMGRNDMTVPSVESPSQGQVP